jgi:hypothetical protein
MMWRIVPFERPEQLCPPVGFERSPQVVGKTTAIGRPSGTADLNHHLGAPGTIGDLPEPTARIHTSARVPAKVGTDLPPTTRHYEYPAPARSRPPDTKGCWSQSVCGPLIAQVTYRSLIDDINVGLCRDLRAR